MIIDYINENTFELTFITFIKFINFTHFYQTIHILYIPISAECTKLLT